MLTLVYSSHDGGWYWERRSGDWATSQVFRTQEEAKQARRFWQAEVDK